MSIDWQISCGPPLGEEPADPPQEDVVDCYTPEHGGYAVDVYLTEWVQFVSSIEGYPLLTWGTIVPLKTCPNPIRRGSLVSTTSKRNTSCKNLDISPFRSTPTPSK